ncbi:hypothetical protein [Roseovarius spongiae]|uniref:hypothetical protein n=1 Tax=Roseovarius spongiae TaxID=2320272 RepID=UPI001FE55019|nr:hypothetical protein [Roseovarius spongiae]
MSMITPDEGPTDLGFAITSLKEQLGDMRAELEAIQAGLRAGKHDLAGASRMRSDIRQWLKLAIDVEMEIEKREKTDKGIVNGYALDLDAARTSVGCRLDRLRRARCPKGFPRQP